MARGDSGPRAKCVLLLASVGDAAASKGGAGSTAAWGGAAIVFLPWSAFVIDVAR